MRPAAARRLEHLSWLSRALALLVGAVVAGQVYSRGAGAALGMAAGLAGFALAYALLLALLRRQRRLLNSLEGERPFQPGPGASDRTRARRRVLRDPDPPR